MAGLYFHIPFCKQACYYCDFHFSTNQTLRAEMVEAMVQELTLQKNYLENESIETIYLGGGTPSLLNESELQKLVEATHRLYKVAADAEITVEVNPDDLTEQKLLVLKNLNINRLSIGLQSFSEDVLRLFNRAHRATEGLQSFERARKFGFKNISVDLIYGVPGQSHQQWEKNIDQVIALSPEHISAYSLTIEENTVFGRWASKKQFEGMAEEGVAEQFELLMEKLACVGYEQYEISNFAKPGFYSRHNSNYWKQKKYLGIGPSAHSFNMESRQFNIKNNALYIKSLQKGVVPYELEKLTRANQINEYLLTTLRTSWGCNLAYLANTWHYHLAQAQHAYIKQLTDSGLAIITNDHLILTAKGKLVADKISSDLFVAEDSN